jgi:small subunit ribosomal protein S16
MPVKIRLTRMGKKKQPTYRVVVVDSRKPRDGAYIEQIGRYDPRQEPSLIEIDNERALDWLQKGAQPTERAQKLLEISGAWTAFRVSRGEVHTIDHATPATADEAATAEAEVEAAPVPAAPIAPDHEPEIHVVGGGPDDAEEASEVAAEVTEVAEAPEDTIEDIEEAAANAVTEAGSEEVPEPDAEV